MSMRRQNTLRPRWLTRIFMHGHSIGKEYISTCVYARGTRYWYTYNILTTSHESQRSLTAGYAFAHAQASRNGRVTVILRNLRFRGWGGVVLALLSLIFSSLPLPPQNRPLICEDDSSHPIYNRFQYSSFMYHRKPTFFIPLHIQ
jgi:hypothetical protein